MIIININILATKPDIIIFEIKIAYVYIAHLWPKDKPLNHD